MTRSQKNKLFGRLSTDQQKAAITQAHTLADHAGFPIGIYVTGDGEWCVGGIEGGGMEAVRVVKPRVRNDIQAVYRSESRKRSAPWEGRGRHD